MRRPPPPLIKKFVKKVSVLVFDRFSKSLNSIAIYGVTLFQLYRLFVPLHDDSILSSTKLFEFILFMTDRRNKEKKLSFDRFCSLAAIAAGAKLEVVKAALLFDWLPIGGFDWFLEGIHGRFFLNRRSGL